MPDKIALVVDGRHVTYGEIERMANRVASHLQRRGVVRGDRVAIFLDNGLETVVSLFAVLKAGAVFMLVNPQTKTDKLGYMLRDARPSALIAHVNLRGVYEPALVGAPSIGSGLVVGNPGNESELFSPFEAVISGDDDVVREPGLIDQDLAAIIYTSGSTGEPKGVMLSHLNMVTACTSVSTYLGLREDDRILCALPLAFDYGLYQVLMAARVGATVVLEKSFAFPVKVLELMAREGVSVFAGVPTMFSLITGLKNLRQFDLSRLRMITNTAAALSETHITELRQLFPQATLFSMYGLTECKRVTYLPPDQLDVRPTSVGRGMPNEEIWLVDDHGNRLPNGSTGELVIRGSHVMRGYWEKPEETAKRLKPGPLPGERVLYSGDLFRTDEEGYLYFVARRDDIIKSRGEKVSPKEVENAVYALKGVREVAVVGVADPVLGQAIKVFVALHEGVVYSERDVMRHCMELLENFMVPKYVEFRAELPKTGTGKIRRADLQV